MDPEDLLDQAVEELPGLEGHSAANMEVLKALDAKDVSYRLGFYYVFVFYCIDFYCALLYGFLSYCSYYIALCCVVFRVLSCSGSY